MRVDLRGGQRRVAQQLLHRAQVGAGVEQMRGEGVPQRVDVQLGVLAPSSPSNSVHRQLDAARREPPAALAHEERAAVSGPGREQLIAVTS